MSRALDMIRNSYTILGFLIRRDSWKPSICYLNAYTPPTNQLKPKLISGCDCILTCKFHPTKQNYIGDWY